MNCDLCNKQFFNSFNGLVEMTFHKIIWHGNKINKKMEDEDVYLNMIGGSRGE